MSKSTVTVTAADLRAFFRSEPKRMQALSPEARKTVEAGARGKVHPEAIKVHNSRRRTRQYVVGATKAETAARKEQRQALIEKGLAGKRGPLPKAVKESLAQSKG